MLKLKLLRTDFQDVRTFGKLFASDVFECYTLEDTVREQNEKGEIINKVAGKTAIPYGTYEIVIDYSPHFGMNMIHILNVPSFTGIRIHPGTVEADTDGCVLVGHSKDNISLHGSGLGYAWILAKIYHSICNGEKVFIEVTK
jgi:hypothetical protein